MPGAVKRALNNDALRPPFSGNKVVEVEVLSYNWRVGQAEKHGPPNQPLQQTGPAFRLSDGWSHSGRPRC